MIQQLQSRSQDQASPNTHHLVGATRTTVFPEKFITAIPCPPAMIQMNNGGGQFESVELTYQIE